jgi:hypothetical protein
MIKTLEINKKIFDQNSLYKDAMILHLIHNGYKKELAELIVERMINKKKDRFDN